jgi:hypothetical protein
LDADVALLDERGQELAWVDDTTILGDPHVSFTFSKAGDYVVRVGSLNGGGNYRLSAGALPYAHRVLPAGVEAGETTVITARGALLDRVDEVWLGDRLAKGHILSKSEKELQARFTVPAGAMAGRSQIHLLAAGRDGGQGPPVEGALEGEDPALDRRDLALDPIAQDGAHRDLRLLQGLALVLLAGLAHAAAVVRVLLQPGGGVPAPARAAAPSP